jgi:hypothetical protein
MAKILGRGIPTAATYAILGQEYIDQLTGKRYICVKSRTITSDKVGEADHYCEWAEESAGGSGGGIIDVTELPTEGIDESVLYRVLVGTVYYGKYKQQTQVHIVNGLPEAGEDVSADMKTIDHTYYNTADGVEYVYMSETLATASGMTAGWYPASAMFAGLGYAYGGVVTSMSDMTGASTIYLLLKCSYHACKRGGWTELSNKTTFIELEATDGLLTAASGTLTDEQYATITADPKNTAIDMYSGKGHFNLPCSGWSDEVIMYKSFESNTTHMFSYVVTISPDKTWNYSVLSAELTS